MAKNRKNQSVALRFGPAVKAFGLCLFIGSAAVGYVWQKNQIDQLGRQIKQRETNLAELRDQNKKLRDQVAILQSPARLQQKVQELNLGLVPPSPRDVWRLVDAVPPSHAVEPGESSRDPIRQVALR